MTLRSDSIEWAIEFLTLHSDGDIFPKVLEHEAIRASADEFRAKVEGKPLTAFLAKSCRRFIVPKDDISYRQATQLHPQDSILLTAIIHQYGTGIEDRRLEPAQVFSYRFAPNLDEGLYSSKTAWNDFWTSACHKSKSASAILYCDIADFYNQIYHHAVENQLIASGFPNQAVKWIVSLLESTTAGVSRGVPIGPHAIHLIAEATLIPIDNSMKSNGLQFLRYADDIVVFCGSSKAAQSALSLMANILDKQQRLMLQRHKTKVFSPADFQMLCAEMIEDRPINKNEDRLLKIIRKYTGGNPYVSISYNDVKPEDWKRFSGKVIRGIIDEYLSKDEVDYIRLRWFYRRLAQVGHPGALDVSVENIERLGPCLANICTYISSIQSIKPEQWVEIGEKLIQLLDVEEIANNEFFRLSILSLFTRNKHMNHFSVLAARFQNSDSYARREILLAARENEAFDWLREHKESYGQMDPWQQMAFIYCATGFPRDERKYFLSRWKYEGPYDETLAKWSKTT
ncbi:RNA-directed DNA polymerase [Halomonas sp. M5N1S17]|uniref:RNA-directed DNA polymerase n=1 Tax=Halomonas alkalisoli TaxID=2907158 RepID=UPI001F42B238|nr:RNA-directed DNA polymerase [Halomonas alkalisoli]MCE9662969.1 RNA-directed DNA polymerase [Halomonas alkalisoli]